MSGYTRTSEELAKNIAVQCLSPTLPRDIPPELLEKSRKVAADQRRIIADLAEAKKKNRHSQQRGSHGAVEEASNDEGEKSGHTDEIESENDTRDSETSTSAHKQLPASVSVPNSPRSGQPCRPDAEPRSAPPYPTSSSEPRFPHSSTPKTRASTHWSTPRFVRPASAYAPYARYPPRLRRTSPPMPQRLYPTAPHTAPYNVRMGPQRRNTFGPYASPYPPAAPQTASFTRPDAWRRIDHLEAVVDDLSQQVSDLQQTNRRLLEAQLQQSQLMNLYGLAQSGSLSPTQFSRVVEAMMSGTHAAAIAEAPAAAGTGRPSAPSSHHSARSAGSRSSSSELPSELFDIIQREQQASDRARGMRLAPNEIPPESELMPSPRLHPPSDWGRMDRSKAPPSERREVASSDKSIPLAGRRCGRFFSLNLNALRKSSQPSKAQATDVVKQESAEPGSDDYMLDADDSDDYDEPAESALTPEADSEPYPELSKPEASRVAEMPSQFMSLCSKMWQVLET